MLRTMLFLATSVTTVLPLLGCVAFPIEAARSGRLKLARP